MPSERAPDESFDPYPPTVIAFEGGPRVDLRRPLPPDERHALASLELGPTFAVMTAEDPGGGDDLTPDELADRARENVRRMLRFEEYLARHGVPFRRADASAPDGSHVEHCVAVAVTRSEAERLAKERDQVALFWYDGERFWLWPAQVDAASRPLPAP